MTPDEQNAYVTAFSIAISQNVMDRTWLQGPADTLEAWSNPQRYMESWVANLSGSFIVPAGVAQINRQIDPVWRDAQTVGDKIISRLPGYSKDIPPYRNLWGEKVLLEGGLGPDIVSPVYRGTASTDPINDWLWENRVQLGMPSKTIKGVELTPWEYDKYVKLAGHGAKKELDKFMAGTHPNQYVWDNGTDNRFFEANPDIQGTRAAIVKKVIANHREMAQGIMLSDARDKKEFPELWRRLKTRAKQQEKSMPNFR